MIIVSTVLILPTVMMMTLMTLVMMILEDNCVDCTNITNNYDDDADDMM